MYDEELERAMLYYLIFEQEQYSLSEEDFVNERNKKIIRAINELKAENKEISMLTIKSKIKANGKQVLDYIISLGDFIRTSSAENVYNSLMELSKKRKLLSVLQTKLQEVLECESVNILAEDIKTQINNIVQVNEKTETFVQKVVNTLGAI